MGNNTSGSSAEAKRVQGFRIMAVSSRSWEVGGVYNIKPKASLRLEVAGTCR